MSGLRKKIEPGMGVHASHPHKAPDTAFDKANNSVEKNSVKMIKAIDRQEFLASLLVDDEPTSKTNQINPNSVEEKDTPRPAYKKPARSMSPKARAMAEKKKNLACKSAEEAKARGIEYNNKGRFCTQCRKSILSTHIEHRCETCLNKDPEYKRKKVTVAGEVVIAAGKKTTDGDEQIRSLNVVNADTIKTERVTWLWEGRIPGSKITLFAGKGDCGKSTVLIDIIARVTTGRDWADGAKNTMGARKVVMLTSEDDPNDTIVPKLQAAGADISKVSFVTKVGIVGANEAVRRSFQLKEDITLLAKALREDPEIALVAFDPISGFHGQVEGNADADMRPLYEQLQETCAKTKTAVIGIIHHNKKTDLDAVQKILGAGSIGHVTRAIWAFSSDPENKDEYYMSKAKGNLSKRGIGGLKYKIVDAEVTLSDGSNDTKPRIEWLGKHDMDANEVEQKSKDAARESNPVDTKVGRAKLLLLAELEKGPRLASEMYALGLKELEADEQVMKRAKWQLNVQCSKGRPFYWSLPKDNESTHEPPAMEEKISLGLDEEL